MKNTAKNKETLEMAAMVSAGMNYRQAGNVYGVAAAAVGQRLRRMGKTPVKIGTKASRINKNQLITLYGERLSLIQIAEAFGVSDGVIKRALKFHRIPQRPRLKPGGKYFDRLRKLSIGEAAEINCPAKFPNQVLRSTAHSLGIKIAIQRIGPAQFQITRIDSAEENRKKNQLKRIDKESLQEMYCDQNLSIVKIADNLKVRIPLVGQALEFYCIAKRPRLWGSGKYTAVFKALTVGATAEVECLAKYPHTNLHTIANRIGIKISLRKIKAGKFKITRVK